MKNSFHAPASGFFMRKGAFTLVELLVVIVVISMLAGLLMPALGGAREAAKKAKAQTMVGSLHSAIKMYYNEYGTWPNASYTAEHTLTVAENACLLQMLQGSNVNLAGSTTANGNPRRIPFLTIKQTDIGKVDGNYKKIATGGTDNLVNPWGNGFIVRIDYDGDNQVTPISVALADTLAIYTFGGKSGSISTNCTWK